MIAMKGQFITFDFADKYVLEDKRVRLQPLSMAHISSLSEISNDPLIWKYFFEKGSTISEMSIYVKAALQSRKLGKEYPFLVIDKQNSKVAGTTRLYEFSPILKSIKLGHTWYGSQFRGSGLNKHCKYLLFEFAFERLQLERVGFGAYASNSLSIKALQSVGCQIEGYLRNMFPSVEEKEGRTDAVLLSILRKEWMEKVKNELKNKLGK